MSRDVDNTKPRFIPPGACSWCGHNPHASACASTIRTKVAGVLVERAACPCRIHLYAERHIEAAEDRAEQVSFDAARERRHG